MKTAAYFMDTAVFDDKLFYRHVYESMPESRRRTADRMRFERDRMLCTGAWYLLKEAVRRQGCDINDLGFTAEKNSKPYFMKRPDIKFSLSHSERRAMCCVSEYDTGCDVEHMRNGISGIAARFFADSESAAVEEASDEDEKISAFFRIWTLKESYIKTTGRGLEIPLRSFSVIPGAGGAVMENSHDMNEYSFFEYNMDDGYRYAVCIACGHPGYVPVFEEITAGG